MLDVVIDECMHGLCFNILVPVSLNSDKKLVYVDLEAIQTASSKRTGIFSNGCELQYEDIISKMDFWLPPSGLLPKYDCYLSYKHEHERDFVHILNDALLTFALGGEKRRVEVFYDVLRLERGRKWDFDFMSALTTSSMIIPIVSIETLRTFLKQEDKQGLDSVILEWALAILCASCKEESMINVSMEI